MSEDESGGKSLVSVDFEIFGHVQGVCFRMYTEKEGLRLGLVGWVKNTYSGTVVGQVQGPADMVDEMTRELLFVGDVIGCGRGSDDIIASRDNALVSQLRKVWLSKEGSPSCRITRALFTNQRAIEKLELSGFRTRF